MNRYAIILLTLIAVVLSTFATPTPVQGMSGSGTEGDPYIIETLTDLQNMDCGGAYGPTDHYALGNNIDASVTSGWNNGTGFDPIGNASIPFNGTLDGRGHTISGLFINRPTENMVGLFRDADEATISNVSLINIDITGDNNVGGLIGYSASSIVANCSTTGTVTGDEYIGGLFGDSYYGITTDCSSSATITGVGGWIGGLVGETYNTDFTDCHATGDITGNDDPAGGFIGQVYSGGDILRCYATGDVTAGNTSWSWGASGVGGFIGYVRDGSSIDRCFATGDVTGINGTSSNPASGNGGFIGQLNGVAVSNCYARGDVDAGMSCASFAGTNDGSIDNCYGTGHVTDANIEYAGYIWPCGGLVSLGPDSESAYWNAATNSFWDIDTTGMSTSDSGTGAYTADMKSAYRYEPPCAVPAWDFENVWRFTAGINDGYPCLRGVTPGCSLNGNGNGNGDEYVPMDLLATPLSSTDIALLWTMGTNATETIILHKIGGWPSDYNDANATVVYEAAGTSTVDSGLLPGTTYYYRAWGIVNGSYSADYAQDMATTFIGEQEPEPDIEPPPWWFQEPTCAAYENVPGFVLLQNLAGSYDLPEPTACLLLTILLIIAASIGIHVLVHNALVTLMMAGVFTVGASIAGLLPLWMIAITVVIGGLVAFAWSRA